MISELDAGQVRYDNGRAVAAGDQELGIPTRTNGAWSLYASGDGAVVVHPGGALRGPAGELAERLRAWTGGDDDRAAAADLAALLGGADDPGRGSVPFPHGPNRDVPRSPTADTGLPPTYPLSGPDNQPTGHTGTASGAVDPDAPAP